MDYRTRDMIERLVCFLGVVGICCSLYFSVDYAKKKHINIFYSDCNRLGAVPHNIEGRLYCLPKQIK